MNLKLAQQQNDTLLSIEADFDEFVAENFGDICRALAKHLRILIELEKLQRSCNSIKVEELIAVIRRSGENDAQTNLIKEFNISSETANYILSNSIIELPWVLDVKHIQDMKSHCLNDIRELLKNDLKMALFQAISDSNNK